MTRWLVLFACLFASRAEAAPRRFGIFVGSNAAASGRATLQHAERDASRLRQVFVELGGMAPGDAQLVLSPDPEELVEAVAAIGQRAEGVDDALLLFYYSGHADDRALLLGEAELPFVDLVATLDAVPVPLSLHVVDACRSGALTRAKGARLAERMKVHTRPAGEGRVVITSSAEWEDAQESDRLGGSFFTLHLASALRGAADADTDGRITLAEAYAYVYGRTVESTLGTMGGPQHPTFKYDLSGRGDVVLTWPDIKNGAVLELAPHGHYLVLDDGTSRVLAEVTVGEGPRYLALRPGWVRVTKRGRRVRREGRFEIASGTRTVADDRLTDEIRHAQLVRKGGAGAPRLAHTITVGGGWRGPIGHGIGGTAVLRASYDLALPWMSFRPRVSLGLPRGFETPRLAFEVTELAVGAEFARVFDAAAGSLSVGLFADAIVLTQHEVDEREVPRTGFGAAGGAALTVSTAPFHGFVVRLGAEAGAWLFEASDARIAPASTAALSLTPSYRLLFGLGYAL